MYLRIVSFFKAILSGHIVATYLDPHFKMFLGKGINLFYYLFIRDIILPHKEYTFLQGSELVE